MYVYPADSAAELREEIGRHIELYNERRPHQSLGEVVTTSKMCVKSLVEKAKFAIL